MDKKDLIKQLKQYVLECIEVENNGDICAINSCDLRDLLNCLEDDLIESLESENKIKVYR